MNDKPVTRARRSLRPRLITAAAIAGAVAAVMVAQTTQTASADTGANKATYLTNCPAQEACLWVNAPNDSDPAKAADRRALVVTAGNGPDLSDPTRYDLGKVHGMGWEFTDDVTTGWNLLPYSLCLLDTEPYDDSTGQFGTKAPLRHATRVLAVAAGHDFHDLGDLNDSFDYYTTGDYCPSNVIFRADTQDIVDRS